MDFSGASDEWLMARAAEGNRLALEALMQRWHRPLYSFIAQHCPEDAEDLYQETWLKAVRSGGAYDAARPFRPWLYRIALNVCRDALRARQSRPRTAPLEAASRAAAPTAERSEEGERLRACFVELPPADRELLSLRYYQGLTEPETAQALGIPVGTVKSRGHQAVRRLKKLMAKRIGDNV